MAIPLFILSVRIPRRIVAIAIGKRLRQSAARRAAKKNLCLDFHFST